MLLVFRAAEKAIKSKKVRAFTMQVSIVPRLICIKETVLPGENCDSYPNTRLDVATSVIVGNRVGVPMDPTGIGPQWVHEVMSGGMG